MLRAFLLLASLMSAIAVCAQEPEYYPYEAESEERTVVLLTDSVLFYRAVQSADDLYGRATDYNLSFVRTQRRGAEYAQRTTSLDAIRIPVRYLGALRALGAQEHLLTGLQPSAEQTGLTGGLRLWHFAESEPLPAARAAVTIADRNYLTGVKFSCVRMLDRGWSLSAAVDARTGRDMHVEGVFTNALTASVRAEKRFAGGDRIALLVVVPPSMRGLRSASTEEAFQVTGDPLYNPAWGYQNGEVRNARIRREVLPLAVASGAFGLSPSTDLAVSLGVQAGVSKLSALGWYDAPSPLPDNYRYLPEYTGDQETAQAWRARDPRYTQVDWDGLYLRNRFAGGSARYALEDRVERRVDAQADARFTTHLTERLTLHYGFAAHLNAVRNYKQMRDLLGADYLTDIDHFLIDDVTYGNSLQNDLQQPRRRVGVGGRFGYDYRMIEMNYGVRALLEYRADRFRVDVAGEVREASVERRGFFEKELFPGEGSFGRSRRLHFTPYAFKLSAGWAFSPRSYLGGALSAAATAPDADVLFFQPQYNNRTVDRAELRRFRSAELLFHHTGRMVNMSFTAFITSSREAMDAYRYYDDLSGRFCNMSVRGIGTLCMGIEAAAEIRLTYNWHLTVAASAGRYRYAADPRVTVVADADNAPVDTDAVSRMGGCKVGNAPQLTAVAEMVWFGRRGWGVRGGVNYAGLRYAEPAYLRRTDRVLLQAATTPEAFGEFSAQERLRDAFTLDASAFKSFRFRASTLTVSLMLRNLLGNRNLIYGAYESVRVRRSRSGDLYAYAPHETRRTYAYPRTFYLSVSYRF